MKFASAYAKCFFFFVFFLKEIKLYTRLEVDKNPCMSNFISLKRYIVILAENLFKWFIYKKQ